MPVTAVPMVYKKSYSPSDYRFLCNRIHFTLFFRLLVALLFSLRFTIPYRQAGVHCAKHYNSRYSYDKLI